jgi:hypothetical protein
VGPDADVYALDIGRDSSIQPGWDPLGSPVALVPGSDQKQPLVVVDAHAEFFVSWLDARSGTTEVYAQRFGGGVPVPVQVSSTSARERDGVVELSWRLHGVTGPGLQVERTVDGHSWSALGALEPGTAGDLWVYDDRAPLAGVLNRYHLRDRASGWTGGEVDVDVQVPGILTRLGVAPNPLALGSRIALSTTSSDPIDLLVNDLAGREVARRRLVGSTEGQSVPWAELYRLPPGLYWLRARQAGAERRTRFVVAR